MNAFIQKHYRKLLVVAVVIGVLIGIFICTPSAKAGGLKVLDTAVEVDSDFTDMNMDSFLSNTRIVHKGELDFDLFLIDWDAVTGWENSTFTKKVDGNVGIYYRIYTVKGGSLEFLGGVNQPIYSDNGSFEFDKVRTISLRVRKPL